MSTPRDTSTVTQGDELRAAMCELISAESSLHMQPDPITPPIGSSGFLTDVDANAAHALEHMHAVFRLLQMAYDYQQKLELHIYKLETRNP